MGFGEQVKKAMEITGITRPELEKRADLKPSYLSQYFKDPNRDPQISTAIKIARALGVSLSFLAGNDDIIKLDELSYREMEIIRKFRSLSVAGQDEVSDYVDYQLSKKKEEVPDSSVSEIA